jgi:hypothetical protein
MRAWATTAVLLCSAAVAGCAGTSSDAATPIPTVPTSTACTTAGRAELLAVAQRIYAQAAGGRNTTSAVRRLARSLPLATAVAAHDARATQAALQPLLKHQITRITISAGGRMLAQHGTTAAYGPVTGAIRLGGRVVGSYVLAVSRDADFVGLVHELTGARAAFGTRARAASGATLPATRFPTGSAVISLSLPRLPAAVCGPTAADTRAATIGFVARNLLDAEEHGAGATRAVRHAEKNPAFRRAIAAGDPAAVRAAIVGFFRDKHFHIVRSRAWKGSQLINDVGGPYVLSPATGTIRSHGGAAVGRFLVAVQDDTGYIKLLHRFTGADVILHMGAGTVPGSNAVPGPPFAPGLHSVTYHGRPWRAVGVVGTAFPSGPLDVTLLVH